MDLFVLVLLEIIKSSLSNKLTYTYPYPYPYLKTHKHIYLHTIIKNVHEASISIQDDKITSYPS